MQWARITPTTRPPATTHESVEDVGATHLETYLTAAIELKFDDHTKLKWMDYSSDSETTPSYEELLKFLDLHAGTTP